MIAAEQKARVTYDNILRLSDDPDVSDVIKFLRAREVVHFQRFGETKRTRWNKMKRTADIKDIQDQNFSDILYYLIRYACRIEFMQSVFAAITKITQGLIVHAFLFTFHFC